MNASSAESPEIRINLPHQQSENSAAPQTEPAGRWSLKRWLLLVALVFVAHLAAVFIFGARKFPPARAVTNVPHLQLGGNSSELIALDDPTIFALPQAKDFALIKIPEVKPQVFRWTESPRWLPLSAGILGATFQQFMQTNFVANEQFDFKPQPKFSAPALAFQPLFAENSTLQIEGDLAQRKLLGKIVLPDWPYADVIAPSKVQVLVDTDGNVISAVLLPANDSSLADSHYADADNRALELARAARFSHAQHLTIGLMIFRWRTVSPPVSSGGS